MCYSAPIHTWPDTTHSYLKSKILKYINKKINALEDISGNNFLNAELWLKTSFIWSRSSELKRCMTSPHLRWTNGQWKKVLNGSVWRVNSSIPCGFSSTSLWHLNRCLTAGKLHVQLCHSSNVSIKQTVHIRHHHYTQACLGSSPEPIIPAHLS